jgi:hypothetical protein
VLDETVRLRIKADRPRRRALEAVDVNLDRPPPADLRHRLHGAELVVSDAAALDLAGLGIAQELHALADGNLARLAPAAAEPKIVSGAG